MTGRQKRRIIDKAASLHGDSPSLEKTLAVAIRLYPEWAAPERERLLRLIVSFELSQAYKQHRYLRAAAAERGLGASLSLKQIRAIFARDLPDETPDERKPLLRPVGVGADDPAQRAA